MDGCESSLCVILIIIHWKSKRGAIITVSVARPRLPRCGEAPSFLSPYGCYTIANPPGGSSQLHL